MKIAYIASSLIPSREANSIQMMKMSHAMMQHGHQLLVIVPILKPGVEPGVRDIPSFYGLARAVPITRVPWFPVKGRGVVFGFLAALRAWLFRPDIVYCRYSRAGFFAACLGLKVVYESHAPELDWSFRRMLKGRNLIKIVCISDALRSHLIAEHHLTSTLVCVAHDAADEVEKHQDEPRQNCRGKLAVGYAGHLYRGKGMEILSDIAEQCDWLHIHVFGGKIADIQYWRDRLRERKNITLHGFVRTADVRGQLRNMDVLLAPYQRQVASAKGIDISRWMSPLKIFDYMSCGVPIVASDLQVLREILQDEENALLCDPDVVSSWVAALNRIRTNRALGIRLATKALADFEQKHTWRQRAAFVLEQLQSDPAA